ncbi:hypothetical protein KJ596_01625 [Patescibacteria group bacterium]|nr:hypothetical protein [Patescibacteria group bacterium]MBU1868240.1 hypothetical protein [Patescibacteria group bacterium]
MSKRGIFVVFEGADGSGKTTQLKLTSGWLKELGYQVQELDFPQYESFWGSMVGRFLKGEFGSIGEVSPWLVTLPYILDQADGSKKVQELLEEGFVVLSNRYITSCMGHQAVKLSAGEQGRYLDWLEQAGYQELGLIREDLVVFLDVPPEIGQGLVSKKTGRTYVDDGVMDIHEENLVHQQKARGMYVSLTEKKPHWVKVNCATKGKLLPREIINYKIRELVLPILQERCPLLPIE